MFGLSFNRSKDYTVLGKVWTYIMKQQGIINPGNNIMGVPLNTN